LAGLNGDADIKPRRGGGTISGRPWRDKLSTTVMLIEPQRRRAMLESETLNTTEKRLSASVWRGGANRSTDVLLLQQLDDDHLLTGSNEVLCGSPHKTSYAERGIMQSHSTEMAVCPSP
jgi:hypothetical protein